MDAFNLIQNFFTRMRCNFCSHTFSPEDIQLIRQDEGIFIVNVFCNHCGTQNGVAMVGVEVPAGETQYFEDPELTPTEIDRLSDFEPITDNDVLDAHGFFNNLDANWMQMIPEELRATPVEAPSDTEEDDFENDVLLEVEELLDATVLETPELDIAPQTESEADETPHDHPHSDQ